MAVASIKRTDAQLTANGQCSAIFMTDLNASVGASAAHCNFEWRFAKLNRGRRNRGAECAPSEVAKTVNHHSCRLCGHSIGLPNATNTGISSLACARRSIELTSITVGSALHMNTRSPFVDEKFMSAGGAYARDTGLVLLSLRARYEHFICST